MEGKIIAAFKSRSQLMSFDAAMRRAGIKTEIVPTPRAVALGCGLSAAFSKEALKTARSIIKATEPTAFEGFYETVNVKGRSVVRRSS